MSKRGFLKPYRTYMFRDRDPIMDALKTAFDDSGIKSYSELSGITGISPSTYSAWWAKGKTRRPAFATAMATARACGKDLVLQDRQRSLTKRDLRVVSSR